MDKCLFCQIANKEIKSQIVQENDRAIAFLDIAPISPGHLLIIPKKHADNFAECNSDDMHAVFDLAQSIAHQLMDLDLNIKGFNYLSNQGEEAGQVIKHFHLHLIPKYSKEVGFGFSISRHQESDFDKVNETILSHFLK